MGNLMTKVETPEVERNVRSSQDRGRGRLIQKYKMNESPTGYNEFMNSTTATNSIKSSWTKERLEQLRLLCENPYVREYKFTHARLLKILNSNMETSSEASNALKNKEQRDDILNDIWEQMKTSEEVLNAFKDSRELVERKNKRLSASYLSKDINAIEFYEYDLEKNRLPDDMDGRVECNHIMSGMQFLFPCCNDWYHCRHCHYLSCPVKSENLELTDMGLAIGMRVRCVSCLHEQDSFSFGRCFQCERYFGWCICEECEIAHDYSSYSHCYKCSKCKPPSWEHCKKCDDCVCPCNLSHIVSRGNPENILYDKLKCASHNNECSICFETIYRLSRYSGRICLRSCGHQFHLKCIEEWLSRNNSCPLCRTLVKNGDKIKVGGLNDEFSEVKPTISYAIQRRMTPITISRRKYERVIYPIITDIDYIVPPSAPPVEEYL